MTIALLVLATWFNWAQIATSVLGLSICVYSVMEGIFMIWDKLVHGIPVFWVPD